MALINSLFSGVSGLRNHQVMMDVVGNNIANVNSIGYKTSRVTFADAFSDILRYGSNPSNSAGGTNTFQLGLGMKVNSIDRDWTQGTFERTGITTDLALKGDALFVLKSNGEKFYSRAGNFVFDADGNLVNPQNGSIVQGKVATADGVIPPGNNLEDIKIDTQMKLPAVATSKITWGGNLKSSATLTRSENYVENGNIDASMAVGDSVNESNTVYDDWGNEYSFKVTYTKTAADTYDMSYELKDENGNTIVGPSTHTVAFDSTTGKMSTIDGNPAAPLTVTDTDHGINFSFDPTKVTQETSASNLDATVDDNRDSTLVSSTITVYDSLGNSHEITIKFTKVDNNKWYWKAEVPTEDGTLSNNSGTIEYNTDGTIKFITPSQPSIYFTPSGGASGQYIDLDFGTKDKFDGITQTSDDSVISALSQNGSPVASLSNINIDQFGYIIGVFSNGQTQKLAQLLLAKFPNRNGLVSVGDNMFTVAGNTGEPVIGTAGANLGTTIESGALEQSNVDLSAEFTKMIVAQRGFQANARVITVTDSLLQEVTNLVR